MEAGVGAAGRGAGLSCVALLTGGFAEAELREAGAALVFDDLPGLRAALPGLPFRRVGR